ncbi:hypothetical protein [Amaricoccus solimangrovi]|uniref:Uncharacterized protein n=1 Tax=Amaricoccus solimangrovi TaxID=2589815 RepID=A0A501WJ56_9RHOB|nr:hypothetical protein [Amaricoccus solimangrovi]TPE49913.1 hypothetical protein FJM51_13190 [Amaricoccus solimangrovi]
MAETLLSGSTVWLFGGVMTDITFTPPAGQSGPGPQGRLFESMKHKDARLARIFSFGFEGQFVSLEKPAIFLVHGDGAEITKELLAGIGLPLTQKDFAAGVKAWEYDRDDMTLRLDQVTGSFSRVLIDYEMGREGLQDYVRGGRQVGAPTALSPAPRRGRRFRSDDD